MMLSQHQQMCTMCSIRSHPTPLSLKHCASEDIPGGRSKYRRDLQSTHWRAHTTKMHQRGVRRHKEASWSSGEQPWKMPALSKLGCPDIVLYPKKKPVQYTKYVLCKRWEADGQVCRYKARVPICGYEEDDYQENKCSSVAYYANIKMLLSIFIEKGCKGVAWTLRMHLHTGECKEKTRVTASLPSFEKQ